MNPTQEFLSAPVWLLTTLHVVTLTLHLAAMSVVFGGVAVLLLTRVRDKWTRPPVRKLVQGLPSLMAATVTLGVAPLLFLQLVYYREVYAAAIVSGWFWLGIVGAVILAYYLFYSASFAVRAGRSSAVGRLVAAFVLVLFVSMVFSSVFTLAERPGTLEATWAANQSGLVLNPEVGRWIPRWLHMIAGAMTLGAFALAVIVRKDGELFASARRSFLWSGVSAIVLGFAALVGMGESIGPYMVSAAPWWMLGSLVLTLAAFHLVFRDRLGLAGGALVLSLVGMVVQRHVARLVVLDGAVDPGGMAVRPQWGVFALFLVCFVVMVVALAWMARLVLRSGPADATA